MWQFDEYGNPKPPQWPPPSPMDELVDQSLAPPEQPMPEPPPPPPAPNVTNNQMTLEDDYGIRTRGPMADQATENAQEYRANQGETFDRLGQNMPQQYGTAETTSLDEGPLSPQETAERMPTNKGAMEKLILQHMLKGPKTPQASKDGYENYVAASREKRAAEKAQLREQGQLNRAATREKTADAWDQTIRQNELQGAGPGVGGRGSRGMGSPGAGAPIGGGNDRVQRIGGYTFVKGTWRPQTPEENANVNLKNAQADYMRERPGIAREGHDVRRDIALGANQNKLDTTGMRTDAQRDIAGANLGQKGEQFDAKNFDKKRLDFDNDLARLRVREGKANELFPEFDKTIGGVTFRSRDSAYDKALDTDYSHMVQDPGFPNDPKKKIPLHEPGSRQTMIERALMLADELEKGHKEGRYQGQMSDDVIEYILKLREGTRKLTKEGL